MELCLLEAIKRVICALNEKQKYLFGAVIHFSQRALPKMWRATKNQVIFQLKSKLQWP